MVGLKLWLHRADTSLPRAEFSASMGWMASISVVPSPHLCLVSVSSQPPRLGFLFPLPLPKGGKLSSVSLKPLFFSESWGTRSQPHWPWGPMHSDHSFTHLLETVQQADNCCHHSESVQHNGPVWDRALFLRLRE